MTWPKLNNRTLILALLPLLLAVACSDPRPDRHDAAGQKTHEEGVVEPGPEMLRHMEIRTAPVSLRVLPPELQTTGRVDFVQDRLAHVSPRIPGRVEEVLARLGDPVRKGQVLAVIDSIELGKAKADYLQARAREELHRQNFEREAGLFAQRISSEKEMLVAKAARLEATAGLRNAEETLRLYGIGEDAIRSMSYDDGQVLLLPVRAPLPGRVVEKHVTVGELVVPERSLFTIADLGHVWVWIDVYERDLGNVHLDDDVAVTVDACPGVTFEGKLSYLSAQVNAETRTVLARIDVINTEGQLRPGMFARVTLTDPHSQASVPSVVVPSGAVQRDGDDFVVFVEQATGRFERRVVTVGRTANRFVEILSGVDPEDTVVVEGGFLLKSEDSKDSIAGGHEH